MAASPAPRAGTYARAPLFLVGLVLCTIGVGDYLVGRAKVTQYDAELAKTDAVVPYDRESLFPAVTEGDERRQIALAKLGYYQLLVLVGEGLIALGAGLLVLGIVRVRLATPVRD